MFYNVAIFPAPAPVGVSSAGAVSRSADAQALNFGDPDARQVGECGDGHDKRERQRRQ